MQVPIGADTINERIVRFYVCLISQYFFNLASALHVRPEFKLKNVELQQFAKSSAEADPSHIVEEFTTWLDVGNQLILIPFLPVPLQNEFIVRVLIIINSLKKNMFQFLFNLDYLFLILMPFDDFGCPAGTFVNWFCLGVPGNQFRFSGIHGTRNVPCLSRVNRCDCLTHYSCF